MRGEIRLVVGGEKRHIDLQYGDFVHLDHLPIFAAAAKKFDVYILVRKTRRASLSWIGKRGFTGKRADMRAKTADVAEHRRPLAGLVCSPELRPGACSGERLDSARKEWAKSSHLVWSPYPGTIAASTVALRWWTWAC